MNNWQNEIMNLGEVQEKVLQKFMFKSTKPLAIEDLKPGCSCTKAKLMEYGDIDVIMVNFTPPPVSEGNSYKSEKTIRVKYADDTPDDVLMFKAIVKK